MTEIIQIILQILFISTLTFFCVPEIKLIKKSNTALVDRLSINSIILTNILLLFSFTNLNTYILLILLIIFSLYFLYKIKKKITFSFDLKAFYIFLPTTFFGLNMGRYIFTKIIYMTLQYKAI